MTDPMPCVVKDCGLPGHVHVAGDTYLCDPHWGAMLRRIMEILDNWKAGKA